MGHWYSQCVAHKLTYQKFTKVLYFQSMVLAYVRWIHYYCVYLQVLYWLFTISLTTFSEKLIVTFLIVGVLMLPQFQLQFFSFPDLP